MVRLPTLLLVVFAQLATRGEVPLTSREVAAALDAIRGERLQAHVEFLADDLLEGRGTGTRGHELAARYVAAQFRAIGLAPVSGRYLHPVDIRAAQVDQARTTLEFRRKDGSTTQLQYETDFVVAPDLLKQEDSIEAEVVFAGYCVSAPEYRYNDFTNTDVRGKLVACLRGVPPSFPTTAQVRYSDFEPKYTALAERGAVGMVDLPTPQSLEQFPWSNIVRGFRGIWMVWRDSGQPAGNRRSVRGAIVLGPAALAELFRTAPLSFADAIAQTDRGELRPFNLGATLRVRQAMRHTNLTSPNVIGVLPGSDPVLRHEYVLYTAHLDHLGVGPSVNGDSIYNGASDNASGTAALIEVARSFAALTQRPRRSILFVAVTGEEAGLVGSDYLAHNPPVRLEQIVANINIDGIAAAHPALADVVAITDEHSTLHKTVQVAAERVGLEKSPDPAPERLYALLGDQASFRKVGIPAVWMISGNKSSDPAIDIPAFKRRWTNTIYHTPLDDISQSWNWRSAVLFTRVQFLVGYIVANSTVRPAAN